MSTNTLTPANAHAARADRSTPVARAPYSHLRPKAPAARASIPDTYSNDGHGGVTLWNMTAANA